MCKDRQVQRVVSGELTCQVEAGQPRHHQSAPSPCLLGEMGELQKLIAWAGDVGKIKTMTAGLGIGARDCDRNFLDAFLKVTYLWLVRPWSSLMMSAPASAET